MKITFLIFVALMSSIGCVEQSKWHSQGFEDYEIIDLFTYEEYNSVYISYYGHGTELCDGSKQASFNEIVSNWGGNAEMHVSYLSVDDYKNISTAWPEIEIEYGGKYEWQFQVLRIWTDIREPCRLYHKICERQYAEVFTPSESLIRCNPEDRGENEPFCSEREAYCNAQSSLTPKITISEG